MSTLFDKAQKSNQIRNSKDPKELYLALCSSCIWLWYHMVFRRWER